MFRLWVNRRASTIVMKNILTVQILVDRSCRVTDIDFYQLYWQQTSSTTNMTWFNHFIGVKSNREFPSWDSIVNGNITLGWVIFMVTMKVSSIPNVICVLDQILVFVLYFLIIDVRFCTDRGLRRGKSTGWKFQIHKQIECISFNTLLVQKFYFCYPIFFNPIPKAFHPFLSFSNT